MRFPNISTLTIRLWLKKARENGGEYTPPKWKRSFTIAQLTAELHTRWDNSIPPNRKQRKELRKQKAAEKKNR